LSNFAVLALFFALIYFMMIRPQQKQQKKRREMLSNLSKGDQIVTIGGIYGVIKNIKDEKVVVEVAKGINITFTKSAIGQVIEEEEEEEDTTQSN
jgi:preprotein translocase subunit YajC